MYQEKENAAGVFYSEASSGVTPVPQQKPITRIGDSLPGLMQVVAEIAENNERIRRSAAQLGGERHALAPTPARSISEAIDRAVDAGASKFDIVELLTEQLLFASQEQRNLADTLEYLAGGALHPGRKGDGQVAMMASAGNIR